MNSSKWPDWYTTKSNIAIHDNCKKNWKQPLCRPDGSGPLEETILSGVGILFISDPLKLAISGSDAGLEVSIMSSMWVRLSHLKPHWGECLTFLNCDTSTWAPLASDLFSETLQQLPPIFQGFMKSGSWLESGDYDNYLMNFEVQPEIRESVFIISYRGIISKESMKFRLSIDHLFQSFWSKKLQKEMI